MLWAGLRGPGTTAQFYDDRSTTWQHGRGAMIATAKADPGRFIQVCASLIPKSIEATITPTLPGGLDPADWRCCAGFGRREASAARRRPA